MMLIYETEESYANASEADFTRVMELHNAYPEKVTKLGGKVLDGEALQPSSTATTIRGDVVTDGLFAETKEVLGGYYLIEAEDLDQALAIGKVTPAPYGGVEVRPIMVFG
jgi:hypothetical protein